MARVNLIELPHFLNNSGQTIYIIENVEDKYLIDWNTVGENVDLVFGFFGANRTFDLLELNSRSDARITYIVGQDTTLKYALAEMDKSIDSIRFFDIDKGGHIEAGSANFATGQSYFNATFNLNGTGASAAWRLATVAKGGDDKVFNVSFHHEAKNTTSNMENYGVVIGKSQLQFAGISHVKNGSSGSAAHQTAKITLFDEKSIGKANPILKIDENELAASHAATVGRVNEEHLFYLTSRGIDEKTATTLLTLGYLNPILSLFEGEEVGEHIKAAIEGEVVND